MLNVENIAVNRNQPDEVAAYGSPITVKAPALRINAPTAPLRPAEVRGSAGSSLMEMIVVLTILSLLAAMAAPYARKSFRREKEIQLRETLRTVRTAIDRFHADMEGNSTGQKDSTTASENGYPLSLKILVEGVQKKAEDKKRKHYLRSLPVNPFAPAGTVFEAQWTFVSYQRETPVIASSSYGATLAETQKTKKDIYDLHAVTPEVALDGTRYADW
ncbi:MAG: type II secretion system protein [Rhodomicrobium sp.]